MSARSALSLAGLLGLTVTLGAQAPPAASPKPGPEIKRLDAFVGKWNFEGPAQPSPYGPAGKATSIDTYEVLPGGFFVVHHWDAKQGATAIKGMEVIGYDAAAKNYVSHFFDNAGNTGVFKGMVEGNTWTWTGESEVAGKPLTERCTNTLENPNSLRSKCEYSTDGTKWMPNFELKGTRAK